jgi:hypothetical protein
MCTSLSGSCKKLVSCSLLIESNRVLASLLSWDSKRAGCCPNRSCFLIDVRNRGLVVPVACPSSDLITVWTESGHDVDSFRPQSPSPIHLGRDWLPEPLQRLPDHVPGACLNGNGLKDMFSTLIGCHMGLDCIAWKVLHSRFKSDSMVYSNQPVCHSFI